MSRGKQLEDPGLLTVKEVALAVRVSPATVYRLVQAGELGAVRVGRSIRVKAEDLRAFLESRRVVPEETGGKGRGQAGRRA